MITGSVAGLSFAPVSDWMVTGVAANIMTGFVPGMLIVLSVVCTTTPSSFLVIVSPLPMDTA